MSVNSSKSFVLSLCLMAVLFARESFAAAPELGRLFTSASERVQLDHQRRQELIQDGLIRTNAAQPETEVKADVVFNGLVQRSDGRNIIWINGEQVEGKRGPEGVRIYRGPDSNNKVVIGYPGKRAAYVEPGQRMEYESGRVAESYSDSVAKDRHVVTP